MSKYAVIVVGTDGSDTSLKAVDKAASLAAEHGAKLIVASAYLPDEQDGSAEPDQPQGDGYKAEGNADVYAMLQDARVRAEKAGARDVEERPITGSPVDALAELVEDVDADLLVVGNLGEKSLTGRLFGSVPRALKRGAKTEVLVVDTAD